MSCSSSMCSVRMAAIASRWMLSPAERSSTISSSKPSACRPDDCAIVASSAEKPPDCMEARSASLESCSRVSTGLGSPGARTTAVHESSAPTQASRTSTSITILPWLSVAATMDTSSMPTRLRLSRNLGGSSGCVAVLRRTLTTARRRTSLDAPLTVVSACGRSWRGTPMKETVPVARLYVMRTVRVPSSYTTTSLVSAGTSSATPPPDRRCSTRE
mmetsp:Transcript_39802/g.100952  ORF Transcript_39802/g.100952 Transcript_39802/m.100952 type:complete len:216 (+) Transcript_39802:346-993(+)